MVKRRKSSRAVIVAEVVVPEHPLIALARSTDNARARRFYLAMAYSLPHMTGNEMDTIEPMLEKIIGRVAQAKALDAFK